jgi:4-hydroxybenzoate polyprenyltransferase
MKGLLKASHFGPTVIVVTTTFILSLSQYSATKSLCIAIAIFAGQLIVGWSNDLFDYQLDASAGRSKKPLVSGEVSTSTLKVAIPLAGFVALGLSLVSPLSVKGTFVHVVGILSALAYNAKLKNTLLSPLPFAISFGALPWAIFISHDERPPLWLVLGFILISIAFHFLNVLKDLTWDLKQGVFGLPQRLGRSKSIAVAIALVITAVFETLLLS